MLVTMYSIVCVLALRRRFCTRLLGAISYSAIAMPKSIVNQVSKYKKYQSIL